MNDRSHAPDMMNNAAPHVVHRPSRDGTAVTVAHLSRFDEVIDVRSESEFAEDHVPGAVNCPVLNDEERARVGTIYKQVSAFDAKKIGAALVSANIARHLRERFQDRPRAWHPLVYCWRGGSRSAAFAYVLQQVGWRAARLDGGYKAYRRQVVADLAELPRRFAWRAVCGLTGAGKSRLLAAIERCGGQVLDLEGLAAHRGSVLGNVPDRPQPSQKMFESLIRAKLHGFSPARPVYVEAESKKIGVLRVPDALIDAMWTSPCIVLEAPLAVRVALLKEEYAHFLAAPATLAAKLECLASLHGHALIAEWKALVVERRWNALIEDLLIRHYDPAYQRSTLKHYPALEQAQKFALSCGDERAFAELAERCVRQERNFKGAS